MGPPGERNKIAKTSTRKFTPSAAFVFANRFHRLSGFNHNWCILECRVNDVPDNMVCYESVANVDRASVTANGDSVRGGQESANGKVRRVSVCVMCWFWAYTPNDRNSICHGLKQLSRGGLPPLVLMK